MIRSSPTSGLKAYSQSSFVRPFAYSANDAVVYINIYKMDKDEGSFEFEDIEHECNFQKPYLLGDLAFYIVIW